MAYLTFRVEVIRDEWQPSEPVGIEITAYIDRGAETDASTRGLTRAAKGVWNSRQQMTGDFASCRRRSPDRRRLSRRRAEAKGPLHGSGPNVFRTEPQPERTSL
jgi:hypothetical protein